MVDVSATIKDLQDAGVVGIIPLLSMPVRLLQKPGGSWRMNDFIAVSSSPKIQPNSSLKHSCYVRHVLLAKVD